MKARLKKEGSGNTFIVTLIALFFLLLAVYVSLRPLEKLGVYMKLLDVGRGAMFRIEADGGMTKDTENLIVNSIKESGLNESLLEINSNKIDNTNKQSTTFGNKVTLILKYQYKYKTININGFSVTYGGEKTDTIQVKISSTAKN